MNTFLSSHFSSCLQRGLSQDFIAVQGRLGFVPVALWLMTLMGKKDGKELKQLPNLLRDQPGTRLTSAKPLAGEQ